MFIGKKCILMAPVAFSTVLLDFSGLYDQEDFCPDGAVRVDLRDLDGTACFCDASAAAQIRSRIRPLPAHGLHWIDGGDYHYASLFWLEKVARPFALVLFDHHPDDQPGAFGADLLSCGSWVAAARARLPLLRGVRWIHSSSSSLAATGDPSCDEMADQVGHDVPIYLSIDLDVLGPDDARTNWDQGTMTLPALKALVKDLAARHEILGIDVCGGLTEAQGATLEDLAINRRTRTELQELFVYLQAK